MRHRVISLAIGLALLGGAADAGVRLIEAGIICPRETTGEDVPAPGTEAGFIRQIDQSLDFDLNAREVPTLSKLSFGFRTALKDGEPAQTVTVVVIHPPMGPRGITREEWPAVLAPGGTHTNVFTFDHDYEKVPGPWSFAIEVGGEIAVKVDFTVIETGARGPVEQACFQFMS